MISANWNSKDLPRIAYGPRYGDIRMLWHSNYYDGAISGMCVGEGTQYWFESFLEEYIRVPIFDPEEDYATVRMRIFHLLELTPAQLEWQEYWHNEFKKYVGTHIEYDENGLRDHNGTRDEEEWEKFYTPFQADTKAFVLVTEQLRGWFSEDCILRNR